MNFKPDSIISNPEKIDFRTLPIEDVSRELREKFQKKIWRDIPIAESPTSKPKFLEVIPNRPIPNQAMAWPAYYKTVTEGLEDDGKVKGFGELAQTIEGGVSSPLVKVRAEVKMRLDKAQRILDANPATQNLQLVVVDGYRRIDVQKRLFDAFYSFISREHPDLDENQLKDMTRKMVSEAPSNFGILRESPPPHSTGGSVDIVLVFKDKIDADSDYWLEGAVVPFGAKYDEMMDPTHRDERSETIFYEKQLRGKGLSEDEQQALEYRRILYHTLKQVGFSNYFNEFWHYDFGNQFDALTSGKGEAPFGFAGGIDNDQIVEDLSAEEEAFRQYSDTVGREEAERVRHHFGL